MALYAVLDIDRGLDVDDIRVLEVLNERITDLETSDIVALVDESWFESLDNAEDLATVIAGDSDTYRDAAVNEIKSAIQHVAAEVFLGHSRDITQFTDSADRTWLMTGGPSWGEPPTEQCDAFHMLDSIGISKRPIEQAPNPELDEFSDDPDVPVPRCPRCTSTDLASIESLTGKCEIVPNYEARPGNETWSFGGHTEMFWDSSTTIGWQCSSCDWKTNDSFWIEPFKADQQ